MYSRKRWQEERAACRPVVFLNLVRNVNTILSHLSSEMFDTPYDADNSLDCLQAPQPRLDRSIKFTVKHQQLREKLAPLANIQRLLEEQLGLANLDLQLTSAGLFDEDMQRAMSLSQCHGLGLHGLDIRSSDGPKLDRLQSFWGSESLPKESDLEDEIVMELAEYRRDIKELWEDDIVKEVLSRRKVKLEDAPGL